MHERPVKQPGPDQPINVTHGEDRVVVTANPESKAAVAHGNCPTFPNPV